ncbi:MAG TPA: hypothetical protein VGF44_06370 [Terriglobales bacterium]|jgi:hypothetical protein
MRRITLISSILLACALLAGARDKSVLELAHEAQAAPIKEQPKLYIEIARTQLDLADKAYSAGNPESAKVAVDDVVEYSGKATDASIQSGSKLKDTEIRIRKMSDKLRDIKRNLNLEDQPAAQSAMDKLEAMRSKLLAKMFEKKK